MFNCLLVRIGEEAYNPITNNSCFFDMNGQCIDYLVKDDHELFEIHFNRHCNDEIIHNAFVIFVNNENEICGWYQSADLFQFPQFDMATGREYRASCRTDDTFLLKTEYRLKLSQALSDFREVAFLDNSESDNCINSIQVLKKCALFEKLSMTEVPDQYKSLLISNHTRDIYEMYCDTVDAFLLPVLLKSALVWSASDSQDPNPWDYLGIAYLELAMPEKALQYFERALEIDPNRKCSAIDKGKCLIRLDRANESIKWLNSVRTKYPNDENCLYELSQAYLFAGFPQTYYRILKDIKTSELKRQIELEILNIEENMPYLCTAKQSSTIAGTYPLILGLSTRPLLETYIDTSGTARYIDPIRKKGIAKTPEETVRQNLIAYLINSVGIPAADILVEESFSHIDRELKKRVDILVKRHRAGRDEFILLIECKAPGIMVEGAPTAQLLRYNEVLQAPYVMLSNGDVSYVFQYESKKNEYSPLLELPTYENMCCTKNILLYAPPVMKWRRPNYEKLFDKNFLAQYVLDGTLGEDTPFEIKSIALNMYFCLLDEDHKIDSPLSVPGCQVVADYGVVALTVGNAGGGTFDGNYRWLGAIDRNGNRSNVYISIFGTMKTVNDPRWENRNGVTTMTFAIEENGIPISRLQLRLDDCLVKDRGSYLLTHNGKRSRAKVQPLLKFIEASVPALLGAKAPIELGHIKNDQNLVLSNSEVAQVIGNAISYVLLRSELRALESATPRL